jgi:hypothetical protein
VDSTRAWRSAGGLGTGSVAVLALVCVTPAINALICQTLARIVRTVVMDWRKHRYAGLKIALGAFLVWNFLIPN